METAFENLLGGGVFGAAAFVTVTALAWFGRATITHYFKSTELRADQVLKASIDFKARQLTEFYWPIYVRLQKDNAVWDKILDKGKSDEVLSKVAFEIENKEILPNHGEIVATIETKIHLAQADRALQNALMLYVRHVAVYRAMRSAGVNERNPIDMNEPYPAGLFDLVKNKTERLQSEYDALIASAGLSSPPVV